MRNIGACLDTLEYSSTLSRKSRCTLAGPSKSGTVQSSMCSCRISVRFVNSLRRSSRKAAGVIISLNTERGEDNMLVYSYFEIFFFNIEHLYLIVMQFFFLNLLNIREYIPIIQRNTGIASASVKKRENFT